MRIKYVVPLKKPVLLEDHWPIPLMAGELRAVGEGQQTTALEIIFAGQPTAHAPQIRRDASAKIATIITSHDHLLPFVRMRLESAVAYLQCYFDIEIIADQIEVEYAPETDAEKDKIDVFHLSLGKIERPLQLSFDFVTRALMAAEKSDGPSFEATLVSAARKASQEKKFIDSFRYSFLLIESVYGAGKFKNAALTEALKSNQEFAAIVADALREHMRPKKAGSSDTDKLLACSPSTDDVIGHLVEKRGFYFHGNIRRKDAWKPHDQTEAEVLCLFTLEIAMLISHAAAAPMFEDELSKRHYEDAKRSGAIMTMKVDFTLREPDQGFDRQHSMTITVPGTTVTPKMARYTAQQFLESVENNAPATVLKSASCTVKTTGQKVFDMQFHIA